MPVAPHGPHHWGVTAEPSPPLHYCPFPSSLSPKWCWNILEKNIQDKRLSRTKWKAQKWTASEKAQRRRPLILQRSICWPASYSTWLSGKESACQAGDAGDMGSLPGSGRSSGVGNGNPLLYSWLENSMDRGAWWATVHGVAKSWHDWATEHTHAPAIVQGGE